MDNNISKSQIGYKNKMVRCKDCANFGTIEVDYCDKDGHFKDEKVKRLCNEFCKKGGKKDGEK